MFFCDFFLQGHVQQYQLYYIRGVSQERNAVTEEARNSKGRALDTFKSILKQNISNYLLFPFTLEHHSS